MDWERMLMFWKNAFLNEVKYSSVEERDSELLQRVGGGDWGF